MRPIHMCAPIWIPDTQGKLKSEQGSLWRRWINMPEGKESTLGTS